MSRTYQQHQQDRAFDRQTKADVLEICKLTNPGDEDELCIPFFAVYPLMAAREGHDARYGIVACKRSARGSCSFQSLILGAIMGEMGIGTEKELLLWRSFKKTQDMNTDPSDVSFANTKVATDILFDLGVRYDELEESYNQLREKIAAYDRAEQEEGLPRYNFAFYERFDVDDDGVLVRSWKLLDGETDKVMHDSLRPMLKMVYYTVKYNGINQQGFEAFISDLTRARAQAGYPQLLDDRGLKLYERLYRA